MNYFSIRNDYDLSSQRFMTKLNSPEIYMAIENVETTRAK